MSEKVVVTYSEQLHPWCIIRVLPDNQHQIVARFRRQNEATAYLQVLHNSAKTAKFLLIFEVQELRKTPDDHTLS
ncbi:hypothetical protein ACE1AT_25190 [Pelatocladus sp. BLCC-F211]|uniref:hypothetical protein n=1 Tax=Pelatocladus sp. BLCC-F211 TaxID=3342752 RepID=UPI0035B82686